jgi:pyruvate kinase
LRRESLSRTKIVCTIGPASQSPETLEQLINAGMDVARLNFAHGTHSSHSDVMKNIRRLAGQLNKPTAILQDLAGPKIRIGAVKEGLVTLESGAMFTLTSRQVPGDDSEVSVNFPALAQDVKPGDSLLLSDGALELEVKETSRQDIKCRVVVGGPLSSFKGINLPTRSIRVSMLTDKDRNDLAFGMELQVDYIALSFVRNADDVLQAKRFMEKRNCSIPVIAKIEKHEAVSNIDEIIKVVDGIMVARGDLGVEIPLEKVPLVQKMLIEKANRAGKPVITATQMLRSMVESPRPTRAEVTDVANAVFDGTDAVMLSEETAAGNFPLKTVSIMSKIAEDAEAGIPYESWSERFLSEEEKTIPESVGYAACKLAESIHAACIITFTHSGSTAQTVAKYRPRPIILAPTPDEKTYRRLALIWGVIPILSEKAENTDEMISKTFQAVIKSGLVESGEKAVITAGIPVGKPGTTNMIKAEIIGVRP